MLQARAHGEPSVVEQFETRRDVIQMQQQVVTALEARLVGLQVRPYASETGHYIHAAISLANGQLSIKMIRQAPCQDVACLHGRPR